MKDSASLRLAIEIWLAAMGVVGFPATLLSFVLVRLIGSMLDFGILKLDISLDRRNQAMKDPRWRDRANKLFTQASAKVYTEKEKDEIRKQYLEALGDYGSIADRLRK